MSPDDAMQWIGDMQARTKTTYRVTRGVKTKGKKIVFKTIRHCQHKRKATKRPLKKMSTSIRNKKTQCAATLTVRVKNTNQAHPCEVTLVWDHNHSLECAKALSFRPIDPQTVKRFESYFDKGHSPSSALHFHQLNLAIDHDDIEYAQADRSINPQYSDVFYMYRKWRLKNHGERNGEGMFTKLEEMVGAYNAEKGGEGGKAFLQRFEKKINDEAIDTPLVLAICTPLMARAHATLMQAGELVHCDSTASLDRCNCPTFVLSTASAAGGIPLGVVITSGESEATLTESFSYLKSILPANAFFGKGGKGPAMVITDDCDAEKNALKLVWPGSTQLLCIFHYLQSWWKWLWSAEHGIDIADRQSIMMHIRGLVYLTSDDDLQKKYDRLTDTSSPNSFTNSYPQLMKHLQSFWDRRSEWALSHRVTSMTRGNNTNNYAEAAMRVLKEMIFGRVKAYNLIQMFEFITTTMETYYCNRLLDIAHSRYRPGISLRYRELTRNRQNITTKFARDSVYTVEEKVPSSKDSESSVCMEYVVDMELGTCSCTVGCSGAACRHQAMVAEQFQLSSVTIAPVHSVEQRHTFATIARGTRALSIEFYADLQGKATEPNCNASHHCDHPTGDMDHPDDTYTKPPNNTDQPAYVQASIDMIEAIQDLVGRLKEGDHQLVSGAQHFTKHYQQMLKSSAPNSAIAYALHNFGKSDSEYC